MLKNFKRITRVLRINKNAYYNKSVISIISTIYPNFKKLKHHGEQKRKTM